MLKKVLTGLDGRRIVGSGMTIEFDYDLLRRDVFSRGWTAQKLAKQARVSGMTITRVLRGEAMSPVTARKIAKALGVEIERYILTAQGRAS